MNFEERAEATIRTLMAKLEGQKDKSKKKEKEEEFMGERRRRKIRGGDMHFIQR